MKAIEWARTIVPEYARALPVTDRQIDRLAAAANLSVHTDDFSVPAILTFPFGEGGRLHYRLGLAQHLPIGVRRYITLHETQHIRAEDIGEDGPVVMHFREPLPVCEPTSDLFALLGLIDVVDVAQGVEWVEKRIRELVPLDDRGWQTYRIQDLAPRVIRMRRLIDEMLD